MDKLKLAVLTGFVDKLKPAALSGVAVISGINECVSFSQWALSAYSYVRGRQNESQEKAVHDDVLHLSSGQSGSQEQDVKDDVLPNLQIGLKCLRDSLQLMYDLLDRAEKRSHEDHVAKLVLSLKDALYNAEELLDELTYYNMKVELEGDASMSPSTDIFNTVIQVSLKRLNDVRERLNFLSSQLERMGLPEVTQCFDKAVRPETSSLPNEAKLFGRHEQLNQVIGFLTPPIDLKRKRAISPENTSSSTSPSNEASNESSKTNLPVLPIVGIGGVGKTTLAQHVCDDAKVKSHFSLIIWICVSDDFDVRRLTKEVIQSFPGKEATDGPLNPLQKSLTKYVKSKRLLIVLDDIWGDALSGDRWRSFCAPFESAREGSMMLVTTRSQRVADGVRTMPSIMLEGLKDDVFWDFFKLCAFGSESSNNHPILEDIGKNILPKLKGSPLAAKTLGRMLRMYLQESHWNNILRSELWELNQEPTDILPALQLSYIHLPRYLKRCFSFCAVYPKDHKFKKEDLAEIWVAEGFVEPEGSIPIQEIGCHYFEELVTQSFIQRVGGHYLIHDLLHDMAQKVSEHDCFILRNKDDFHKVPTNVRHVYILKSSNVSNSDLMTLCKYTKLHTILCEKELFGNQAGSVIKEWCTKLLCMRVVSFGSANLSDDIGNWKHLRYLKIEDKCPSSFPQNFCCLYQLEILDVRKWKMQSLPPDFSKLISLRRFKSHGFSYYSGRQMKLDGADNDTKVIRLIKNLNQFRGKLDMINVRMLSKGDAAEAELKNKKYLIWLSLQWYSGLVQGPDDPQIVQQDAKEVLQVLQPPDNLKYLILKEYPGVSLPIWFQPQNLPSLLTSLVFDLCNGLEDISFCMISPNINSSEIPVETVDNNKDGTEYFLFLAYLTISRCKNLSSLGYIYLPAIKIIKIEYCDRLASVPTEWSVSSSNLEDLIIRGCPSLNWQRGLVLPSSIRTLELVDCGDFSSCVPRCLENLTSLVSLKMAGCAGVKSIPGSLWCNNLSSLTALKIHRFPELVSIGGAEAVGKIKVVEVLHCPKLLEREEICRRHFT